MRLHVDIDFSQLPALINPLVSQVNVNCPYLCVNRIELALHPVHTSRKSLSSSVSVLEHACLLLNIPVAMVLSTFSLFA